LGNSRGSDHGLKHRRLKPTSKEFWNFSFHEIGTLDLPAMLDYIFKVTGSSKVHVVGHSQGATSLMVLLSTYPEYNAKIVKAYLFGPAIYLSHFSHPVFKLFINEIQVSFTSKVE